MKDWRNYPIIKKGKEDIEPMLMQSVEMVIMMFEYAAKYTDVFEDETDALVSKEPNDDELFEFGCHLFNLLLYDVFGEILTKSLNGKELLKTMVECGGSVASLKNKE